MEEKKFVCAACGNEVMASEKPASCDKCGGEMTEATAPETATEGGEVKEDNA